MFLSIVVPCYNEEKNIKSMVESLTKQIMVIADVYELVFVNDGSKDGTINELILLSETDTHVKYISFSRNFGKESAMLAGMRYASGDCIIVMDADLQHPPELIPQMLQAYEEGYDQVIAKRNRNKEKIFKKFSAKIYYRLVNRWVDVELKDGIGDFRLLSRKAVDAVLSLDEYNRFSKGLFAWVGFKQKVIEYENVGRLEGDSKWSFKSLLQYGIDGALSFNNKPLRICFLLGAILISFMIIYLIYIFYGLVVRGIDVPGYITTISLIAITGGVQLISVGVLGEYVGRIYYEVKKRPHYLVESTNIEKYNHRSVESNETANTKTEGQHNILESAYIKTSTDYNMQNTMKHIGVDDDGGACSGEK